MRLNHEFESDQWWIDYMEDECEPGLHDGLELLLRRSDREQKKLAEYEGLRNLIKQADDVYLPESGAYYADQRRQVMKAIFESEGASSKRSNVQGRNASITAVPLMLIYKNEN